MDYKQIVFLSAYPKSGNTWLRCFFEAYITGKVDINNLVTSVTDDSAARALPGDGSDPGKYPIDVQQLTRPMANLRLVREYAANKCNIDIDIPLFVKTHNAHMLTNGIELLPMCLTKAVIHVVRDPRDVIVSFAKHMGKDIDTSIGYFFDKYRVLEDKRKSKLSDFISSWPMHIASYANSDSHNVMCVRFEDMKGSPAITFGKIVRQAGMEVDAGRIWQALEICSLDNMKEQEAKSGFQESSPHAKDKFFGDGSTGGWRDILLPRQVYQIEKHCKSMMSRFDYKTDRQIKRAA